MGYENNLLNVWYFSSCSIAKFKSTLLVKNSNVSSTGQCLLNSPSNLPVENNYFNKYLTGQLWDVEQQCKIGMNFDSSSASECGVGLLKFSLKNIVISIFYV